jgi:hypothetical protein
MSVGDRPLVGSEGSEHASERAERSAFNRIEDLEDSFVFRWAVDIGPEAALGEIAELLDALHAVIKLVDFVSFIDAFNGIEDSGPEVSTLDQLAHLAAMHTVLRQISYENPLAAIFTIPKQFFDGAVAVLGFVVDLPWRIRKNKAEADKERTEADKARDLAQIEISEAEAGREFRKWVMEEVKKGKLKLTKDQIFQVLSGADYRALALVASKRAA